MQSCCSKRMRDFTYRSEYRSWKCSATTMLSTTTTTRAIPFSYRRNNSGSVGRAANVARTNAVVTQSVSDISSVSVPAGTKTRNKRIIRTRPPQGLVRPHYTRRFAGRRAGGTVLLRPVHRGLHWILDIFPRPSEDESGFVWQIVL